MDQKGFWWPKICQGSFVWAPPPAAADVALEELRKARMKRQDSTHVFVCPRLLTTDWLRQLHKAADLVLEIPAGTSFWTKNMFEPLILGICFPFIDRRPWQLRGTPKMFSMVRKMRKVFQEEELAAGSLLRKFLLDCRRIRSVQERVVWGVLYFESRGEVLRQGERRRAGTKRKRPQGCGETSGPLGT